MTTNENKILRAKWLKTVTLPDNEELRLVLSNMPTSIHPLIDDYLSIKERQELLIKHGWIKVVTTVDGNEYCYTANPIRMNREIMSWLLTAKFMSGNNLTPGMRLSATGESYI